MTASESSCDNEHLVCFTLASPPCLLCIICSVERLARGSKQKQRMVANHFWRESHGQDLFWAGGWTWSGTGFGGTPSDSRNLCFRFLREEYCLAMSDNEEKSYVHKMSNLSVYLSVSPPSGLSAPSPRRWWSTRGRGRKRVWKQPHQWKIKSFPNLC